MDGGNKVHSHTKGHGCEYKDTRIQHIQGYNIQGYNVPSAAHTLHNYFFVVFISLLCSSVLEWYIPNRRIVSESEAYSTRSKSDNTQSPDLLTQRDHQLYTTNHDTISPDRFSTL